MAHIPDGVLSLPVIVVGAVATAGAVALSLRRMDEAAIPRTAILAAVFFTTSAIAIPAGPSSVHLLLSGLMGLILGLLTFPAVLVGLVMQALLFGFGGLTTLGINTLNIALPGVLIAMLLKPIIVRVSLVNASLVAGLGAAASVALTGAAVAVSLALSSADYIPSAKVIVATYVPLMVIEAVITGFSVMFLRRVMPEMFQAEGAS